MATKKYIGRIKNITSGQWVTDEVQGVPTYDKLRKNACIFNEVEDAQATLELLNDNNHDCFILLDNFTKELLKTS